MRDAPTEEELARHEQWLRTQSYVTPSKSTLWQNAPVGEPRPLGEETSSYRQPPPPTPEVVSDFPYEPLADLTKLATLAVMTPVGLVKQVYESATTPDASIDHDSHPQNPKASWYGEQFHGKLMSNKQRFDMNKMTAAHRKLPFGTKVRVTDKHTGKNVVVEITDRGPYKYRNRVIDLSKAAAQKLGILEKGTADIKLDIIEKAKKQPPHIKVTER